MAKRKPSKPRKPAPQFGTLKIPRGVVIQDKAVVHPGDEWDWESDEYRRRQDTSDHSQPQTDTTADHTP